MKITDNIVLFNLEDLKIKLKKIGLNLSLDEINIIFQTILSMLTTGHCYNPQKTVKFRVKGFGTFTLKLKPKPKLKEEKYISITFTLSRLAKDSLKSIDSNKGEHN